VNASPSKVRFHRILGCFAVLHAAIVAAIFIGLVLLDSPSGWFKSTPGLQQAAGWLFVVFATLWFLWPFVLIFHSGRSVLRVVLPLLIAYPFYFIWSHPYSNVLERRIDREKLGLPFGVDLSPHEIFGYMFWYGVGWVDAKKDARAGRLVLEAYGFGTFTPGAPNFRHLQEKCNVEINQVAGCVVNTRNVGHAKGYNLAMMEEVKRRCGLAVVREAEEEDARWLQSYDDGKEAGRAEALNDLRTGCLAIEVSDRPKKGDAEFEKMLDERYQISLRRVNPNADPKMANNLFGHAAGYNEVAEAEITRRFGNGTVEGMWKSFYQTPVDD
jgi:hypothetical protein